jgi:hypothetical protein
VKIVATIWSYEGRIGVRYFENKEKQTHNVGL